MSSLKQFETLPATCVSDALQGMNNLDFQIKPVKPDLRVFGRAYTVKLNAGDNLMLLKAMQQANAGDVLVVDAKSYTNTASAGDFIIGLVKTLGFAGIVIDGVIRDIKGIQDLDFPVFCKGVTTSAPQKFGTGHINVPISCGNVAIHPGDLIVGDDDGVVCVPKDKEMEILKKAVEKLKKDEDREASIIGKVEKALAYINQQLSKKGV